MKESNKRTQAFFCLGFTEMIPLPGLGFLRVFLANHLASNDDVTKNN